MGRKKSTAPEYAARLQWGAYSQNPVQKKISVFQFEVIITQHSPVRSSFQTCRNNKPNFFFPFSVKCAISLFLHFSSFFHQRTTITPEGQRFRLRSRREHTCPIHKRIRFVKTLTPIVQVFVCIGQFSKGTVRSKKTPLWLANRKVSEKTFLLGSGKVSYREKIIMPLT